MQEAYIFDAKSVYLWCQKRISLKYIPFEQQIHFELVAYSPRIYCSKQRENTPILTQLIAIKLAYHKFILYLCIA